MKELAELLAEFNNKFDSVIEIREDILIKIDELQYDIQSYATSSNINKTKNN